MARPILIYAFDNLGPRGFVELCGSLLASRFRGFLLGGVGPDGGVDAELDEILGEWHPESRSPLLNEVVEARQLVVFQFKHKVVARVGQSQARKQLLRLYECTEQRRCELHRTLVQEKNPAGYVLVTNVEVNSQFRTEFIRQCKSENSDIDHYQIIGLDELETWVTMAPELAHRYFPTVFGPPDFNLRIELAKGFLAPYYSFGEIDFDQGVEYFEVSVLNVGTRASYVSSISFGAIVDGESRFLHVLPDPGDWVIRQLNPRPGTPVEPGSRQTHKFRFADLAFMKTVGTDVFPVEVIVSDEIGNRYSEPIPEDLRNKILGLMAEDKTQ